MAFGNLDFEYVSKLIVSTETLDPKNKLTKMKPKIKFSIKLNLLRVIVLNGYRIQIDI